MTAARFDHWRQPAQVTISLTMPEELHDRARVCAADEERSMNNLIRRVLRQYVERWETGQEEREQ